MGNQQYTDQENRKKLFQAFNEVYRTGEPTKEFDWEVFRKDGTKVFGEISVSLIKDSKGKPIGFRGIARDITERKRAEEALRNSEERFRIAAKSSSDLIWDWGILDGNLEWFGNIDERLGYNPGEFPRTIDAWEKIIHPDEHDRVMTALDQHLKMHKPYMEEYRVQRKDGTFCYWTDRGTAFWDEKGNPFKMIGACEDITERKRSEESLEKSEMRFIELFNDAPVGYFEYNVEGLIKNVNRTYLEMLGYKFEEMIGQPVWKFIVEEEVARQQILEKLAGTAPPGRGVERTYRRKDGTRLPVLIEDRILRDSEGRIIGIRTTIQDITERKHTEESLRESEVKYRQLVEYAPSGIFEIDLNTFKFLNVNDVMCEVMGYSKEEFLSISPLELLTEENRNLLAEGMEKMLSGEKISDSAEVKLRTKDKSEFWALVNTKMFYKNGKPFKAQVVAQDISERKRLEEQLIQSQKMEAVGQLAGGIAHDFNNLLTVIKGYGQLSLLDLKESDPLWGNIQEIQKATQRASDLTRQLLAFSRRQILDLKVLNLNSLVRDLNKMLRRIIGEDIELITLLNEDLGRVKVDPGQIEQLILNLAVNARDAMPSGGKLIIETKNVEIDVEYVAAHIGLTPGRYVRLSVSDTGVGMSQEIVEKAFEPFFTTKETGKGTGLGLSTVYGIVKQSGGSIQAYSEPGFGTTFNIFLPRVEENLDALDLQKESDLLPKGSETVLLVEDESSVRNLAYRILCQQGYTVLEAANGDEALCIVQEHIGKEIDLLLTDVVMPRMSGKELADRLKTLKPELKVLFTSGYTDDSIVHRGVLATGTHFLQKPFSPKTLSQKVREVLDR
jgi:two-component system cell cycle sensor histidine kinase/response regulator CckA